MTATAATPTATAPTDARSHHEYGTGALIVCDTPVRIYQGEQIEVQALQGLHLDLLHLVDADQVVAHDQRTGAVLVVGARIRRGSGCRGSGRGGHAVSPTRRTSLSRSRRCALPPR